MGADRQRPYAHLPEHPAVPRPPTYPVPMDAPTAARYLQRLGVDPPPRRREPDVDTLRLLQRAHLTHVPFENLDIHLGVPVDLAEPALVDKIIDRGRGGFCYELNALFAALLRHLGYHVDLLQAVVRGEGPNIPFDHLTLRVEAEGRPWLTDVGFGKFAHHPLHLTPNTPQTDPDGVYRFTEAPHGDLDLTADGEPQLRIDLRPRRLAEFVPTCWWHQTSPDSKFTRRDVCSVLTEDGGRRTLRGRRLITTSPQGEKSERTYDNDGELLNAYATHFGIRIPRLPAPASAQNP